jgi:tryptophan-rich sensory protein
MKAATIPHPGRARTVDSLDTYAPRDLWAGAGGLLLLVLLCAAVPVGAGAAIYQLGFLRGLELPYWTPVLEVWAGVAAAAYLSMALAAWLVVRQRDLTILGRWAIVPFETQLALGGLAAVALFVARVPGPALALLIVQAGALTMAAMRFYYMSRPASRLLVFSLLAVMAALAWTGMLVVLNPEVGP